MANVTTMTFVIGMPAALRVQRQLVDTAFQLQTDDDPAYLSLPRQFERLLRQRPCQFDVIAHPARSSRVRVIWEGEHGAGLLYISENDVLRTLNVILSEHEESARRIFDRAVTVLNHVKLYDRCFSLIRRSKRPLIATFCDSKGELSRGVDLAMFDFARVFFARVQTLMLAP